MAGGDAYSKEVTAGIMNHTSSIVTYGSPMTNSDILLDPARATEAGFDDFQPTRLSSLLSDAPAVAQELARSADATERPDAQIVYRNISAILARAIRDHDSGLFSEGIAAVREFWEMGDRTAMYPLRTPDFEASLWEVLTVELYALGGLGVCEGRWAEVREITLQSPPSCKGGSWLRQGQVASSRSSDSYQDDDVLESGRQTDGPAQVVIVCRRRPPGNRPFRLAVGLAYRGERARRLLSQRREIR